MSTRPIPSNGDRSRQQARLDERSQARTSARALLRATAVLLAPVFPASLGAQGVEEICSGRLEEFDQPPFESFDTNGDDYIETTESEGCRSLHGIFEELDVNDDERLSRIEYGAFAFVWAERARAFGLER